MVKLAENEQEVSKNFDNATIECQPPNEFLHKFEGKMTTPDGKVIPLDADQVVLRGSSL